MQRIVGAVVNGVDQAVEVDGAMEAKEIVVVFGDIISMNVTVTTEKAEDVKGAEKISNL